MAPWPANGRAAPRPQPSGSRLKSRGLLVSLAMSVAFLTIAGQLARLSLRADDGLTLAASEPATDNFARPDIVDRNGRLLATDVETPSLFADASLILDRNEVVEKLGSIFPDLDTAHLLATLSDTSRRFVWIRRGLSPRVAQQVHDLGLPGLSFRTELKRAYPAGTLAGHLLGSVTLDNKGLSGIERYLDDSGAVEAVHGATRSARAPLRLALDLGVQHALEDELARAMRRYGAEAAAGTILDVTSGEVVGAASLPAADPARPAEAQLGGRADRIMGGAYELGSIFKLVTVATALETGKVTPETVIDVTRPIVDGRHTIVDPHPAGRPLAVREIFTRSSNVGAGLLALGFGGVTQREYLARLRLTEPLSIEGGTMPRPILPSHWQTIDIVTVSYGHGIAVPPLQFAAAAAALVNGGVYVPPTLLRRAGDAPAGEQVVSALTSTRINEMMRLNVTDPSGTGRRADVPGYAVGGKTGTAEIAVEGRYRKDKVISSFLGAFPMDRPQYVVLLSLFEPKPGEDSGGEIAAGANAAPSTARLIRRIAPLLGVLPEGTVAAAE